MYKRRSRNLIKRRRFNESRGISLGDIDIYDLITIYLELSFYGGADDDESTREFIDNELEYIDVTVEEVKLVNKHYKLGNIDVISDDEFYENTISKGMKYVYMGVSQDDYPVALYSTKPLDKLV